MNIRQSMKWVAVSGILMTGLAADGEEAGWYGNCSWRQTLTINKSVTSAPLTNFPFLVAITNQDAAIFGRALSDGRDIVFTTGDGLTKLDHEIETYTDTGAKSLVAWVRIPLLPADADTTIRMFYGDSSAADQQNVAGVWTNGFLGVWHLNESVSAGGTNRDSSASLAHAVRQGSSPSGAAGVIGGANAYNGTDDYSVGSGVQRGTNEFTISAWVFANDSNWRLFEAGDINREYIANSGGQALLSLETDNPKNQETVYGPNVLSAGAWHYVVAMASAAAWDKPLYVDNVYGVSSLTGYGGMSDHKRAVTIGGQPAATWSWNGRLDELRVESVKRSLAWIGACYNNQKSPVNYIALAPVEERIVRWYSTFKFRQVINIDKSVTYAPLTNFPFLVAITNQANPIFGTAKSDGGDIVFVSGDSLTKLDHEIETYTDTGSKSLIAWVRIPVLSPGTNTVIQMFYGGASLPGRQNAAGVWSDNFLGVWHLNEAVSAGGVNRDSSPSLAHAVRYGSTASGTAGLIGGGNAYNGTDDRSIGGGVPVNTNGYTLSAWVYSEATTSFRTIMNGSAGGSYLGLLPDYAFLVSADDGIGEPSTGYSQANFGLPGGWHYVVALVGPWGWQKLIYVDGVYRYQSSGGDNSLAAGTLCNTIGAWQGNGACWYGKLDELRVEGAIRDGAWQLACYYNQRSPGSFLTFGVEEVCPPLGTLFSLH